MATRSFIAIQDGTIYRDIYCHNDGYLSYNGYILKNHYNTIERVNSLIELGDLSYLGQLLSKYDTHQSEDGSITFAYGRDRGEEGTFARVCNDESKLRIEEYTYLFRNGIWYWRTDKDKTFRELTDSDIENDL